MSKWKIICTLSSSFLSALNRPLCRAAGGIFGCSAYQRGAERADPEAGARPEHHPVHVFPATPRCRWVGGQQHGEHPRTNQRGHCHVYWYVTWCKKVEVWGGGLNVLFHSFSAQSKSVFALQMVKCSAVETSRLLCLSFRFFWFFFRLRMETF